MAASIYKNQTGVDIIIETGLNLTGLSIATSVMKYISPSGVQGQFNAVVDNAPAGLFKVTLTPSQKFTEAGDYVVWIHITFTDGNTAIGTPSKLPVYEEGRQTPPTIVTLSDVKAYLKVSGDAMDDFLQFTLVAVSNSIERYLRGKVKLQNIIDEIGNGDGSNEYLVRYPPIVQVGVGAVTQTSDIQTRYSPYDTWRDIVQDARQILIDTDRPYKICLYNSIFPQGRQNIKISYRAGYNDIPGEIIMVALERVAEIVSESKQGSGRLGQVSRAVGSGGVSQTDSFVSLSDRHKKILNRFVWYKP
jgi:hypothetical protein